MAKAVVNEFTNKVEVNTFIMVYGSPSLSE